MTISHNCRSCSTVNILSAVSAANTAAATSSWIDTVGYKGNLVITHNVGAVTGSITAKLRSASSNAGANAADITGATFTACSDSNHVESVVVYDIPQRYIQYVGTIVTGPVLVSVTLRGFPTSSGA